MDVLKTVLLILFYSTFVYCVIGLVGVHGYAEVFNQEFKKSRAYSFFRITCTWSAKVFLLLLALGCILALTGVIESDSGGCYTNPYYGDSSCDDINN